VVGPTAVLDGSVSLRELVSRGGMVDVYEAHGRLLGRIVAIKVLAPAFDRVRGLVERFCRGARAAAHLS
jgi:eukaryotic-like serine/threonine-protein kinase